MVPDRGSEREHLDGIGLYRRSFSFGGDGWLTAEFAKRGDGVGEDVRPDGSAYPDYFLIGQPHMNLYEGSARIDDLRLYAPED